MKKHNSTNVYESIFTLKNGVWKNCNGEGPACYKFRVFYQTGIDLSKFSIVDGVLKNKNNETADEYIARVKADKLLKKQAKINRDSVTKLKAVDKKVRGRIKKRPNHLKRATIGILSFAALIGTYYYGNKLSALTINTGFHDVIQNTGYEPYTRIPAGYYNEHPLKICISNNFSTFSQFLMRKGLEYLDENALGAKFDIVIDDARTTDAPVKVLHSTKDIDCYYGGVIDALGWTWNEFQEAEFIDGEIVINENAFHPYTIANTIVHEACHMIFRLRHSSNPDSIMCRAPSNIFLSKQDIENINTTLPPACAPNEAISVYTQEDATVSYIDYLKKLAKQKRNNANMQLSNDESMDM